MLTTKHPNYYFVRKEDFNSPHLFHLNLFKPFERSKIRTFIAKEKSLNEKDRELFINKIHAKFLGREPLSSQIIPDKVKSFKNTVEVHS